MKTLIFFLMLAATLARGAVSPTGLTASQATNIVRTLRASGSSATNGAVFWQNAAGDPLLLIREDGRVAIGRSDTNSLSEAFEVSRNEQGTGADRFGIRSTYTINNNGSDQWHYAAILGKMSMASGSDNQGTIAGLYSVLSHPGTGILTNGLGVWSVGNFSSSGTTLQGDGYFDNYTIADTHKLGLFNHLHINPVNILNTAHLTNENGILIEALTGASGTTYAIKSLASAPSLFSGNVGLVNNKSFNINSAAGVDRLVLTKNGSDNVILESFDGGDILVLENAGGKQWKFQHSTGDFIYDGNLYFVTDAQNDIGGATSQRPRNINLSGTLKAGGTVSGASVVGTNAVTSLGGLILHRVASAVDRTLGSTDYYVFFTVTKTATLPAAATAGAGVVYVLKSASGVTTTVARTGSDTIDGATSDTIGSLVSKTYISDGVSNWEVN